MRSIRGIVGEVVRRPCDPAVDHDRNLGPGGWRGGPAWRWLADCWAAWGSPRPLSSIMVMVGWARAGWW